MNTFLRINKPRWAFVAISVMILCVVVLPTVASASDNDSLDAVPELIGKINSDDPYISKRAHDALMRICNAESNTDKRETLSNTLCKHLADRESYTVETRIVLCNMLSYVGGSEAVTPLYKAMNEPKPRLQDAALRAMIRNSDWTVSLALIGGLQTSAGDLLIGVINGLAERPDPRAMMMLSPRVDHANLEVGLATLNAFAAIPDPQAAKIILDAVQAGKPGAKQAILDWSEMMVEAGSGQLATKPLVAMVDDETMTIAQRCQWLRMLGLIGGELPTNFLIRAIDDKNPHLAGAAIDACVLLPGEEASTTLLKKASSLDMPKKARLLQAMNRRTEPYNKEAQTLLTLFLSDENVEVQAAAIEIICDKGLQTAVGNVIDLLGDADMALAQMAERSLSLGADKFTTNQMVYSLRGRPGNKRPALIRILGRRGHEEGVKQILAGVTSDDVDTQIAAVRAVGRMNLTQAFDVLIKVAETDDDRLRRDVSMVLGHFNGDDITERLVKAYSATSNERVQSALLLAIGERADKQADALLVKVARSDNPKAMMNAIAALGRRAEPSLFNGLEDVYKNGSDDFKAVFVAACLRMASRLVGRGDDRAADINVDCLKKATTDQHRALALDGILATVPDKRSEMIELIEPILKNETLQVKAARVLAKFVLALPDDNKDRAIPLLKQVEALTDDDQLKKKVADKLEKLQSTTQNAK